MSKRKQKPQRSKNDYKAKGSSRQIPLFTLRAKLTIAATVLVIVIAGGLAFAASRDTQQKASNSTMTAMAYVVGGMQNCAGTAPFAKAVGFERGILDTRANFIKGLALREIDAQGNILRSYQHPSWGNAGYLGAFQRDISGDIFVIPTPYISILDNPPDKANTLYRINRDTGEMAPMTNLPALAPTNDQNVYGLLGLTYDCDTRSLYASSVFGSTPTKVAGAIFQLDPTTGDVRSRLEYVDAFGIGVFNGVHGKRLYFGLARTPDIYSVGLTSTGGFSDDVRLEIALTEMAGTADKRAKSLTFQGQSQLVVKVMPFDFNLAPTVQTAQVVLSYLYDRTQDKWLLQAAQTQSSAALS
jgi:hypothetical protein